MSGILCL